MISFFPNSDKSDTGFKITGAVAFGNTMINIYPYVNKKIFLILS
jgi:hypothetical protein